MVHRYGKSFTALFKPGYHRIRTLNAIAHCRTAYLGGHVSGCRDCGSISYHYNSCRNRHCPKCQTVSRERWILQRESELLPVAYFHIVFTLPHQFNEMVGRYPKEVYGALFTASWQTIRQFASDSRYLGARTGMVAVLHTWGQQLWLHPHLHCIVPGGGITPQGKWKQARNKGKFLFPTKAMAMVFRAKYMSALRSQVVIPQCIAKAVMSKRWVIYAKQPFSSPKTVVEYLGRYTHKIAISNHRLKSIDKGMVSFTYKDYTQAGKQKTMTLKAEEFLCRFSLHILPKGFVRMRHYGMLASKNKSKELNIAKSYFGQTPWEVLKIDWIEIAQTKLGIDPNRCKECGGELAIIKRLPTQRGPLGIFCQPNTIIKQVYAS
ncbi:MAG: IS91 family transposase [Bacteroidetes bacterium]|nr:IS91 family transposase [Bacteroidota bacterium]